MIKGLTFFLVLITLPFFLSIAQKLEVISASVSSDSSFYDICKLNDNEFWICGEHGILKSMDSMANIKTIFYNNQGKSFYKMVKSGKYIYIAADNGSIYKFNAQNRLLECVIKSNKYKNHSFYDMKMLENGKLLVCGGKSKIVKTKPAIPSGFILEIDTSFTLSPKVLWKSKFNFVWSLTQSENKVYAAAYNGRSSKILMADKQKMKFKKDYKIKSLVYYIQMQKNTLWFSGSQNINYRENGIIGNIINDSINILIIAGKGCVWGLLFAPDSVYAFANNGNVLIKEDDKWIPIKSEIHRTIYVAIQKNANDLLLAGNGKTIFLLRK